MHAFQTSADLSITYDGHVALLEMNRPPHNYVDPGYMGALVAALRHLDQDEACRSVVLLSGCKSFCAGADFSNVVSGNATDATSQPMDPTPFYAQAMQLFDTQKPIVAAVHGAAVGAGFGLALVADFRVTCPSARFSVNFNRLGFHPGFGLSFTLPRLVGTQKAASLFYTGRRIGGEEAVAIGLADELVGDGEVRAKAIALAQEIALSAPLAVQSTRAALRQGLHQQVVQANQRELAIQLEHFRTQDFREGVAAMGERRTPAFLGR